MSNKRKRLGELLVDAGLITVGQLNQALERQKNWGGRLGSNLVMTGAITEAGLLRFLASRTGIQELDITGVTIRPEILKLVPQKVAEQFNLVPLVKKDKNTLVVACADPTDLNALDQVRFITGMKIDPALVSYTSVVNAISRFYLGKDPDMLTGEIQTGSGVMDDGHFVKMSKMEDHGGKAASDDPDLIIFGNQEGIRDPADRPVMAPRREPSRVDLEPNQPMMPDETEFTFDFGNQPLSTPLEKYTSGASENRPAEAMRKSLGKISTKERMVALYQVLVKKGLVSESEILREVKRLRERRKLG